jgi:hypothetical protein
VPAYKISRHVHAWWMPVNPWIEPSKNTLEIASNDHTSWILLHWKFNKAEWLQIYKHQTVALMWQFSTFAWCTIS